jgi:hypothetical protein
MLKKSSPLKLLGQMEPNLSGSIYVRSSIKHLHLVSFGQQTWPLLLKIEHMVKLHVFGNNSKTVNNIRNLTGLKWSAQQDLTTLQFWRKSDYLSWSSLGTSKLYINFRHKVIIISTFQWRLDLHREIMTWIGKLLLCSSI